jgi:Caspase domain
MTSRFLFFASFFFLTATAPALSVPYPGQGDAILPSRLALVIGIENYGDNGGEIALNSLPGATQDAMRLAEVLPSLGFKVVNLLVRTDDRPLIDKTTVQAAIRDFREMAKQEGEKTHRAPVLLFYFAGHGFSVAGQSYLIPSNFYADDLYSFQSNAISLLHDVVQKLELGFDPALEIIITDSCRTPKPINIPTSSGPVTGSPGNFDPNHDRVRPAQAVPGRDRSVFFFSTLDGQPAFEESDGDGVGGRFTNVLVHALVDAVNIAKPPPAAPVTLDRIYYDASQDVEGDTTRKYQKPAFDTTWGAEFNLLPLQETFLAEQQSFGAIKLATDDPRTAIPAYRCSLQGLLKTTTEFSYYSQQIIDTLLQLGRCPPNPPPLGGGLATPPTHDDSSKWNVPSIAGPLPAAYPPSQSGTGAGQPTIRGATGWTKAARASPALLNAFAQAGVEPPKAGSTPSVPAESKPNFGDVRSAVEQQGSTDGAGQLPAANVPLDQAVVAKTDLNLRKLPDPQSTATTSVPAGALLQVIRTTPGRTWLFVKHAKLGSGYVSGDLVEPALMTFDKLITFSAGEYDLTEGIRADLAATFSLLGGVAIVDGYVEYPESGTILDLTRASLTAKYITDFATQADPAKKSKAYISIRPRSNSLVSFGSNAVHLVLLALPLDAKSRARLAQSGAAVTLQPVAVGSPADNPSPTCCSNDLAKSAPPESPPTVQLKYCGLDGKICYISNARPDTGQFVAKAVKDPGAAWDGAQQDSVNTIEKSSQDVGKTLGKILNPGRPAGSLGSLFKF